MAQRHLTGREGSSDDNGNTDRSLQPTCENESDESLSSYSRMFPSDDRTPLDSVGHGTDTNDLEQNSKTEKDVKTTGNDQKESLDKDWTFQENGMLFSVSTESITFKDESGNSLIIDGTKMTFTASDGRIVKARGWRHEKTIKEFYDAAWKDLDLYNCSIFHHSCLQGMIFENEFSGHSIFGPSRDGNSVFNDTDSGNSVFGFSRTGKSIFGSTDSGVTVYGTANTGRIVTSLLGYTDCPRNPKDWNAHTADQRLSESYSWIPDLLWSLFPDEDESNEDMCACYCRG